jgi:hypothetical protein
MKVKRRIEIVTVREQTYQFPATSTRNWCHTCGTASQMLTPNVAALISGIHLRTLFRWIESGTIHFVETPEGNVFLCLDSVKAKANNSEVQEAEREVVFSHGSCTTTAIQRSGS